MEDMMLARYTNIDSCAKCCFLCSRMILFKICGHRVCSTCLLSYFKTYFANFRCPFCQRKIQRIENDNEHEQRLEIYRSLEHLKIKQTITFKTLTWRMKKYLRTHSLQVKLPFEPELVDLRYEAAPIPVVEGGIIHIEDDD